MTVGLIGSEKPEGYSSVIVSPPRRAPVAVAVKVVVQVERAPPTCGLPAKPGVATDVAAAMTTLAAGLAGVVSVLVATESWVLVIVVAITLMIPAIVSCAAVLFGTEHVPPLSASVMITLAPELRTVELVVFTEPGRMRCSS